MAVGLLVESDRINKSREYDVDTDSSCGAIDTGLPTIDEAEIIGIRFDPIQKILTAFNQDQDLLSVDIDAPGTDWGMTNSDIFNLANLRDNFTS